MNDSIKGIGDGIADLTLAQAVQLGDYLETVHGIKKVPDVSYETPPKDSKVEAKPEQTEWAVVLDGYEPDKKITVIKVWREISGASIKDAKDTIENGVGKVLKEGLPRVEADAMKDKLTAVGAKVTVK